MERIFAATLEEVWTLWTTREGIESWWGPEGFAVTVRSMDLRPGGVMYYVQAATEPGTIAYMEAEGIPVATELQITFREVIPFRRLVYTTLADFIPGVTPYEVDTEVELEPLDGGVRMTLRLDRMHDETWTERAAAGWTSELARLERRLTA
jgi:uncharacterized protein YndB with AHSA1/START domain